MFTLQRLDSKLITFQEILYLCRMKLYDVVDDR